MQRQRSLLLLIVVLVFSAITVLFRFPLPLGLDLRGGAQLTIQVQPSEEVRKITPEVMEATESVIRNRVNGLGVSEPLIQRIENQQQIVVQLPGVSDPAQAERVLGGTAQLDFRKQKPGTSQQLQQLLAQRQQLRQQLDALRSQLQGQSTFEQADEQLQQALAETQQQLQNVQEQFPQLFERTGLTGKYLEDAFANPPRQGGSWSVNLRFDSEGGDRFAELSKDIAGTGRTIGIFLDNRLLSAPVVRAEFAETGITGGGAEITGNFDAQEANNLAIQLKGGALPVPVEIVENRTVGATLGRDSVRRSIYAACGGLVLVLVFMVFYYRLAGALADVALVIYAILTLASYAFVGVTITLPGIAGFILSIGMAVDANVLIFERTREEMRAGKSLYRSVESGFYRAFTSILDSNVTTLIACGALFWFGTGFVKGFALTLGIGVLISMFTALTCSRTLLFFTISFPQFRRRELFDPNAPKMAKAPRMVDRAGEKS
ncbi:protein translocase subunit SecD [Geitlerinema sp. PCC 9228]|jgi:preprotein translocase subunit SecD|uniref:protein translocase subunit SecD n=1 Tax=Geitlerinema sp. PCC 9228 TaxID=111611 RepID=UPI0008F9B64F|nr:protein translocase subunit SecD [Geitlerinema sp. PCC 9228]